MKELREILRKIEQFGPEEKAVLATVVDLKGSGYRLPGARMLIKANGDAIGTVSGGCLEADVLERAKRVLETGKAEVFVYDTTADENSVFSLNMGCRGVLRILLEAVDQNSKIIAALRRTNENRKRTDCSVIIGVEGTAEVAVGQRFFADDEIADPAHAGFVDDLMTFAGSNANYQTIKYETDDGMIELAFEAIKPPVQLHILGAGADAVPLAEAANNLGWQVNVCDHRPAFLNRERFTTADDLVFLDRDVEPEWNVDDLTAFVLMNHNYDRDKAMLSSALNSKAFYVGALGPKKRTQQILEELGNPFSGEQLSLLRSPAGLDIGGDTPETIAIAIIAEIQSVLKHRTGGPLRDRQAPIYDRG